VQFSDVVGHTALKQQLAREVDHDKISHAQLFLGDAGHGPLPLALSFIQYLFCENKQDADSCGECASCRKVSSCQHPDVHFSFPTIQAISKTSDGLIGDWREQLNEQPYFDLNTWIKRIDVKERKPIISKDESQEIIKKLALRSYEGGYKVMVVWKAEEMNQSCANKLLKILEEPPSKTLFILLAESHEMMLQTILSRTQMVQVPRISQDDLSTFLRTKNVNSQMADAIASRSGGNLLESLESIGSNPEKDENRELFMKLMRVCYKKNVIDMIAWSEEMADQSKEYQKEFLKYGLHMFRQSMLKNYTEDTLTNVTDQEDGFLNNFARFITGNNIFDFMEMFDKAHYHIERNAHGKILFTNLCFQVMRFIHKA